MKLSPGRTASFSKGDLLSDADASTTNGNVDAAGWIHDSSDTAVTDDAHLNAQGSRLVQGSSNAGREKEDVIQGTQEPPPASMPADGAGTMLSENTGHASPAARGDGGASAFLRPNDPRQWLQA